MAPIQDWPGVKDGEEGRGLNHGLVKHNKTEGTNTGALDVGPHVAFRF